MALNYSTVGPTYFARTETGYTNLERRQLFLKSYHFSRKQSVAEKVKKSFFRVKKVTWVGFRFSRKLRRIFWLKLKNRLFFKVFLLNGSYNFVRNGCTTSSCHVIQQTNSNIASGQTRADVRC